MSNLGEMILQEFHNFKGITIGNRREELFKLVIKYHERIQEPEIDFLIQHLRPATYLEQKMFVDVLIHFKREEELLNLFLEGKENLTKPLWKHTWFFEKLLQRFTIEYMVDEIFPQLSYVTRIRFFKNVIFFTKDEKKIDNLYDKVFERYGDSNAQFVLAGCSLEKILQAISLGSIVNFSNEQLIFLHRNKKALLSKLISHSVEFDIRIFDFFDRHSKALNVIGGNDFNIFMEVFRQHNLRIGKRFTKTIMKREISYVLEHASEIHGQLHCRTLYKNLGKNFKSFVYSTWPSSFSNFRLNAYRNPIKFCPNGKCIEIIQEGLNKRYKTSLSEHPELISDLMLDKTEDIEIRESLLELKMEESREDYTLPKYYGINRSVPILKKKISAADGVKTRENLIIALVQTCKINSDVNALLKVQEYFNFRHKNDDQSIKASFLNELKNCFDLSSLTESHWNLIMDLMKWIKVKNEYFWNTGEFLMLHLKFLYKNNTDISDIRELFSSKYMMDILKSLNSSLALINDVPELQECLLKVLLQSLSATHFDENNEAINKYFDIYDTIQKWNEKNSKNAINCLLYPEIKEAIKIKLKAKGGRSYSREAKYFNNFITQKIPCDEEFFAELEQWFWENISENFEVNLIENYLRKNPMKIVEHFNEFILSMEHQYCCDSLTMWRLLKHYDHLSLVEKVINHLISNKKLEFFGTLNIALATLLNVEEYTKLMTTHKSEMLDVDDEEQVKNHQLAIKLLQNAKYNSSFLILPHVVQFCMGDTLHEALPSLYYYFQHTPEKYLLEHLKTLSNRAVSVRKHAVKLACSVASTEVVYAIIHAITEGERNNSVLEHTYWKTFKYFRVNKSERFWILIQSQLKSLDILESNAFKESCDLGKIPKQYRLPFLDFVWNLLDQMEKQGKNVTYFKEGLIGSISHEMYKELSYDFCSQFIMAEFLKYGSKGQRTVRSFAVNCLKFNSQKESLITDIFNVILSFKKNYILNPDFKISSKSYTYIDSFVEEIVDEHKDLEETIIEIFFLKWQEIFSPIEDINNYIRLTFLVKLRKPKSVNDFVYKVSELYLQFLSDFGFVGVAACFQEALHSMLALLTYDIFDIVDENEMFFKLALRLAETENNDLKLLAISLLPKGNSENSVCSELKQKLLNIFMKTDDRSVLINFNLYLRGLE